MALVTLSAFFYMLHALFNVMNIYQILEEDSFPERIFLWYFGYYLKSHISCSRPGEFPFCRKANVVLTLQHTRLGNYTDTYKYVCKNNHTYQTC